MSDRTLPFTVNLDWSTVNWVKQHRYALTLKTPAKNDPKIPSVFVVCCNFLLTLFTKAKYRDKQCGPRSDCSYRSSLIGVYTVCWKGFLTFQQTTKAIEFCFDWRFKVNRAKQLNRRRQRRLVCPVNVRRKLKSYLFTDTLVIYYCSLVRAS